MEDPKSFYEKERARETAEEERPDKETPAEETPAMDGGYFRFDDATEVRMPHPPTEPQKNTLQVTALVLSIVSFFCCGFPLSAVALVLAILDRRRRGRWEGMTTVALVLSIVALVFSLISLIYSVMLIGLLAEMLGEIEGSLPPELTSAVFAMW